MRPTPLRRSILIGAALFLVGPARAATAVETFVSPSGLFRCEVPGGWEIGAGEDSRLLLVAAEPDAPGLLDGRIAMAFYGNGRRYRSAEEFAALNGGAKPRAAKLGKARGLRYERDDAVEDVHLGPLIRRRAYALLAVRGGFFVLSLSVTERPGGSAYARLEPAFERVIKSFEPGPARGGSRR